MTRNRRQSTGKRRKKLTEMEQEEKMQNLPSDEKKARMMRVSAELLKRHQRRKDPPHDCERGSGRIQRKRTF